MGEGGIQDEERYDHADPEDAKAAAHGSRAAKVVCGGIDPAATQSHAHHGGEVSTDRAGTR